METMVLLEKEVTLVNRECRVILANKVKREMLVQLGLLVLKVKQVILVLKDSKGSKVTLVLLDHRVILG